MSSRSSSSDNLDKVLVYGRCYGCHQSCAEFSPFTKNCPSLCECACEKVHMLKGFYFPDTQRFQSIDNGHSGSSSGSGFINNDNNKRPFNDISCSSSETTGGGGGYRKFSAAEAVGGDRFTDRQSQFLSQRDNAARQP